MPEFFKSFADNARINLHIDLLISIHKNGHEVICETSGSPIYDDAGRFIGYRGIVRDITARKYAEEKLKKREEELQEKTIR